MPIYQALNALLVNPNQTQASAQLLLNRYTPHQQQQIIAAIYIGRDHLDQNTWLPNYIVSSTAFSHIPQSDFARIIEEKSMNMGMYMTTILNCAKSANFDLNNL